MKRAIAGFCLLLSTLLLGYLFYVEKQIERQSTIDEAKAADIIMVLGAAEYKADPRQFYKAASITLFFFI